jgi:hypothetical protein
LSAAVCDGSFAYEALVTVALAASTVISAHRRTLPFLDVAFMLFAPFAGNSYSHAGCDASGHPF